MGDDAPLAKPRQRGAPAAGRAAIGKAGSNFHVDFRSCACRACNLQLGSNPLRAFADARKPPVNAFGASKGGRLDPCAVIAHDQPQTLVAIFNDGLDQFRVRMPKGIRHTFTGDPIQLIADWCFQWTSRALEEYLKFDIGGGSEFLRQSCKHGFESFVRGTPHAQSRHDVATLLSHLSQKPKYALHERLCWRVRR